MANFDTAYSKTAVNEGGYRNVGWDAGGETYRGISRVWWPNWPGWPKVDAKKPLYPQNTIPTGKIFPDLEPEVKAFYRARFWQPIQGDKLKSQKIADLIYDYMVQSGTDEVDRIQQSVNTVIAPKSIPVDNDFGPLTLSAVNSAPEDKLHNQILDDRKSYYQWLLTKGYISQLDWQGILNRLARYPYLTAVAGGGIIILAAGLFFLIATKNRT